jgi:hypothetical protein
MTAKKQSRKPENQEPLLCAYMSALSGYSTSLLVKTVDALSEHDATDPFEGAALVKPLNYLSTMGIEEETLKEATTIDNCRKWSFLVEGMEPFSKEDALKLLAEWTGTVVLDFAKRVAELAYVLTGQWVSVEEIRRLRVLYETLTICGDQLIDQFKYSVNLVFSQFFGTEAPAPFKGAIGLKMFPVCLQRRLRLLTIQEQWRKKKAASDIYTVFQGWKKGLYPAGPIKLMKTIRTHREALTRETESPEGVLECCERTVSDLRKFGRRSNQEPQAFKRYVPGKYKLSKKASVESSFGNDGHFGFFCEEILGKQFEERPEGGFPKINFLRQDVFYGCGTRSQSWDWFDIYAQEGRSRVAEPKHGLLGSIP